MQNLNVMYRFFVVSARAPAWKTDFSSFSKKTAPAFSWGFCLVSAGIAAGGASGLQSCCEEKRKKQTHAKAAIYLVGGPSGAGKDTLLAAAKKDLADSRNDRVVFVKRDITRDPQKCSELEVSRTTAVFDAIREHGGYALSWEAHGTKYGIPKHELEEYIRVGRRCVLNVSRTVIDECKGKYEDDETEVYFLNITASSEELTRRLVKRAREPPDEIAERVARAKELEPAGPHVINVVNEASVDEGKTLVVGALTGELKYSLWLAPAPESVFHSVIQGFINQLSSDCSVTPFSPHITLCPSFNATQRSAIAKTAEVAAAISTAVPCKIVGEASIDSGKPFRALALEVEPSSAVVAATSAARNVLFEADDPRFTQSFVPHVSLLYGLHKEDVLLSGRSQATALMDAFPNCSCFEASRVVVVMTTGKAYSCWQEVASFNLRRLDAPKL